MPHDQTLGKRLAALLVQVKSELAAESERGAVVLAFAWMDEELTRTLKQFLIPSIHPAEKADELFGVGRPIGDAATKIDLAYRLAILTEPTYKSLHIFRKLRNDFAHLSSPLSFETASVRDRLENLFDFQRGMTDAIRDSTNHRPEVEALLQPHNDRPSPQALASAFGSRQLFELLAATTVVGLAMATHNVPQVQKLISLYNASEA